MNKLLIALIAGGFATVAAAQTTAPAPAPTKKEMNAEKAKEVGDSHDDQRRPDRCP